MRITVNCPYVMAETPGRTGYVLRNVDEIFFSPGSFKTVSTGCLLQVVPEGMPEISYLTRKPPGPRGASTFDVIRGPLKVDLSLRLIQALAEIGFICNVSNVLELQGEHILVTLFYLGAEPYVLEAFSELVTLHVGVAVPCEVNNEANFPT